MFWTHVWVQQFIVDIIAQNEQQIFIYYQTVLDTSDFVGLDQLWFTEKLELLRDEKCLRKCI